LLNYKFIREVGWSPWIYRTVTRQFYKRILKRDQRMKLPTGEWMTLPASSRCATEAYVTNADVDWGSEALLLALLPKLGAFLDVGANIGYYSLYFSPVSTAVYSFEPDPRARAGLEKNVAANPKIHIIPCALGSAMGKATFVLADSSEVSHLGGDGSGPGKMIEVDVITIDSFVAQHGLTVQAIKIDAEGHDLDVIAGALETMRTQQTILLLETSPAEALFALIAKTGYRVFGFFREPESRKRGFAEMSAGGQLPGETKMLFLVPDALAGTIMSKAAKC